MLDPETRKRIDNARDILVGKVPDPKSQVEQITIALIYKFMDDMDKEAEEFGGKATFFKGEFARYSWSNIFDPKLGGYELISLYGEAITRMNQNKNIPQLFRDIFKNAFLPYRDPETLKSFLKEINDFHYDHSERLGDAFEYLLSVLGVQGDAGSLRTPRHIIDFIVKVIAPRKNETILDPACGTAGFLISAYKHIRDQHTDKRKGNQLTPDDRKRLMNSIVGHDISPDMVRLSLVNMYLHGFQNPKIYEYDTLTSDERWNETYDIILANPPFMTPKGGIRPHKRFSIQANRSEVLFVDYIMEHIATDGRAGVIVPEGIIFQSANAYKALRKALVENGYLYAVVSLPAGVFNPYSGVKTSILLMDKILAKKAKDILFVKIENDGFDLGAQRREIDKSDLPEAVKIIKAYQECIRKGKEFNVRAIHELPLQELIHTVPKTKIAESGDYTLTGDRYRERIVYAHKDWPMVSIGEICNLINGRAFKPGEWEKKEQCGLPIIRIQNLNNTKSEFNYFSGEVPDKLIIKNGDLLFSWSGSRGTSFGPHIWHGNNAILNQHIFKVEYPDSILKGYLYLALKEIVSEVEENLHGGVGLVHITKGNLEKLKIPLPPLPVQQEIVAEIEGYQKIINGARQVVSNYKPQIKIDSGWPMVELGKVLLEKPKNGYSGKPVSYTTNVKVLTLTATTSGKLDVAQFKYLDEDIPHNSPCRCRWGDIYLQRGNTKELVGTAALFDINDSNFIYPDLMIRIRADEDKVIHQYLLFALQSPSTREYLSCNAVGSAGSMPKINQSIVERIPIPLPPLKIQKQIVAQIEDEQILVEANRKLIEIFDGKIKAKIAEVWGEEAQSDAEPELLMVAEEYNL